MSNDFRQNRQYARWIVVWGGLVLLGFIGMWARLFWLQVSTSDNYLDRIDRQSLRRIRIPAQRGNIYTSDLKILADTVPVCNLVLYFSELRGAGKRKLVKQVSLLAQNVAAALGRSNLLTEKKILEHINRRPGLPLTLAEDLDERERAIALAATRSERGVVLELSNRRRYVGGTMAAHLLGYVQKEQVRTASDKKDFFYYIPDQIGKCGLEKVYDRLSDPDKPELRGLRGFPGFSLVRVDNLGFVQKTLLAEIAPRPGNHLVLTLDSRAQKLAETLLDNQSGAFVLLDADTGAVLAITSSPTYNLDRFAPVVPAGYYKELLQDPQTPLLNRSLSSALMPGSIFKPLVALALLSDGVSPHQTIRCDGGTRIGNAKLACTAAHGAMDLYGAIKHSCNDYFVEMGGKLGQAKICAMAQSAGVGSNPEFDLYTRSGVAPTLEYKWKTEKRRWNKFDTALISIGQGTVAVTPLQAAMYTAALANGGKVMHPYVLKELVDQNGNLLLATTPREMSRLAAKPEHLAIVREAMRQVVNAPGGSGARAKVAGLEICGKTGTAEVGRRESRTKNTWFSAFCEYDGRKYAAVLLVQNGASGGRTCAPLMGKFFKQYLLGGR